MAITTATITGTLYYPDGTTANSVELLARRLQSTGQAEVLQTPAEVSATSHSSNGTFSITVTRNSTNIPIQYKILLPDSRFFYVSVLSTDASVACGKIYIERNKAKEEERDITELVIVNRLSTAATAASVEIGVACSDETTALTTGTAKATFRMPCAMTLTAVRASVTTAPTGSTLIVDINESGSTILSTKLSIDATEKTSTTAASAAVISDSALADDAEMTIDIDQVGATIAGAGLKVWLIGTRV